MCSPSSYNTYVSCKKWLVPMAISFTIKQLMLLYCNTESVSGSRSGCSIGSLMLPPGLNALAAPVLSGSMSSSVVLLSSKSVVLESKESHWSRARRTVDAERLSGHSSSFVADGRKLLLDESLDIHHFLGTGAVR